MLKTRRSILSAGALAAPAFLLGRRVLAQSNAKVYRLVVPFSAGGSTDITARLLAEKLRLELGVPVVVENKAGAAGNIGAAAVARSAPDGFTLLFITSSHVSNPSLYKSLPYDLMKDLAPVSRVAFLPNMLVVNKDLPVQSLEDFVRYVKETDNPVNYGSSGTGTSQHMAGALFNNMVRGDMVHIPFKGGGAAVAALIAGQIEAYFGPAVEMLPIMESGRVKTLGVTTQERVARFPDIPAIAEIFPGYEVALWNGIMTTAGVPANQIAVVNAALNKILRDPEVQERMLGQGSIPSPNSVGDFTSFMHAELPKWAKLVSIAGITSQ